MQTTPQHLKTAYRDAGWWGDETLSDWLQQAVDEKPETMAIIDQPDRSNITDGPAQRLSYRALNDRVESLAARFFDAGLRADDIVMVQLPNIAELVVTYFALDRLGVIVSPMPVQYLSLIHI